MVERRLTVEWAELAVELFRYGLMPGHCPEHGRTLLVTYDLDVGIWLR